MKCGPDFPVHRVKAPEPCVIREEWKFGDVGTWPQGYYAAPGLEKFSTFGDVFSLLMDRLPRTSRASLAQVSVTLAWNVSEYHTLWTMDDRNLLNAEFTDLEFQRNLAAGGKWDTAAVRGARSLTVAMTNGKYDKRTKIRTRGSYLDIGVSVLRLFRAVNNWSETFRNITFKHVPFIDHKVLASIVEACPNLEQVDYIGCGGTNYLNIAQFLGYLGKVQASRGRRIHFDATPVFYKGSKYADQFSPEGNQMTFDNKGCFGVSTNDPGIDLAPAILKTIVYDLAPAAKAAGQSHMLHDLTSVCRQSLEALPLCEKAIPLMLKVWELQEEEKRLIAVAEHAWNEEHADTTPPPAFTEDDWAQPLREKVYNLRYIGHWVSVRACFGDNGYKDTADRCFYSSNFKCTVETYKEFTTLMVCYGGEDVSDDFGCQRSFPRYFFNSSTFCESCRLEEALYENNYNLEKDIRAAIETLGFNDHQNDQYLSNEESAFPFEAWTETVNRRDDLMPLLIRIPELQPFILSLQGLDVSEAKAKFPRGRIVRRQRFHPLQDLKSNEMSAENVLAQNAYRRTITYQQQERAGFKGWAPWHREDDL